MKKKNKNKKIMMYIKNGDIIKGKNVKVQDVINFLDSVIFGKYPISEMKDEKKRQSENEYLWEVTIIKTLKTFMEER